MPSSQAPSIAGAAIDPPALRDPTLDDALIEHIDRAALRDRVLALRAAGATMLLDIGAADYPERTPRFDAVYHFLALPAKQATVAQVGTPKRIRLLVGVPVNDPVLPSLTDLWKNADWPEREIFDLFGIVFSGHPNLKRIQMPQDWEGAPLRKDYPLRGPAREKTPRPAFALKSNVPAGAPPSGKVAQALERQTRRTGDV
jgi:NADH:ubiquinone oxidoreductase subunit C